MTVAREVVSRPRSAKSTSSVVVASAHDPREREADAAADRVASGRTASVSPGGACCTQCDTGAGAGCSGSPAPPLGSGAPLPAATRHRMERLFDHDFGRVRVHTDESSRRAAGAMGASAFTSGWDVAVPPQAVAVGGPSRLLAHELAHVVQQTRGGGATSGDGPRVVQRNTPPQTAPPAAHRSVPPDGPGVKVCARETAMLGFGHAFIDAPPFRYGLMKRCVRTEEAGPGVPLVSGADLGMPLNPTAAETDAHSPDPCNAVPTCVECVPHDDVTDVDQCMAEAFRAYPRVSEYVVSGPNSNTFGGVLARRCCRNMATAPPIGTVPGWTMSMSRAVRADCPPGGSQCEDKPANQVERLARGGVAMGLLGAGAGALLGALIGLPFGGAGLGAIIGAIAGGVIGLGAAAFSSLFK